MNSPSRLAAVLAVVAASLGLVPTAAAAGIALSIDVEQGAVAASVDVSAPVAEASVDVRTVPTAPAASASPGVETGPVSVRADIAPTGPPTPREPGGRAGKDPQAAAAKTRPPRASAPHDRPAVAGSSSRNARLGPPPLVEPSSTTGPSAGPRVASAHPGVAQLPERSTGGWAHTVEAAATGISSSPAALAGLVLVLALLVLGRALGSLGPPRPSLHPVALQRPG